MLKGRLLSLLMVAMMAMGLVGCSIFGDDDDDTTTTTTTSTTTTTATLSGTVTFPDTAGTTASIKAAVDLSKFECYINGTKVTLNTDGTFTGNVTTGSEYEIEIRRAGNSKYILKSVVSAAATGITVNTTTTAHAMAYSAYKAKGNSKTYAEFSALLATTASTITTLKEKIEDYMKSSANLESTTGDVATDTTVKTASDAAVAAAEAAATTTSTTTTTTTSTTTTTADITAPTISSVSTSSKTSTSLKVSWTTSEVVKTNQVAIWRSLGTTYAARTASTTFNPGTTLTTNEVINNANYTFLGSGGTSTAQSLVCSGFPQYKATTEATYWMAVYSTDASGNTGYMTVPSSWTLSTSSTATPTITVANANPLANGFEGIYLTSDVGLASVAIKWIASGTNAFDSNGVASATKINTNGTLLTLYTNALNSSFNYDPTTWTNGQTWIKITSMANNTQGWWTGKTGGNYTYYFIPLGTATTGVNNSTKLTTTSVIGSFKAPPIKIVGTPTLASANATDDQVASLALQLNTDNNANYSVKVEITSGTVTINKTFTFNPAVITGNVASFAFTGGSGTLDTYDGAGKSASWKVTVTGDSGETDSYSGTIANFAAEW